MCGRFTMLTWDETNQVARAIEAAAPFNIDPDWPAAAPACEGECGVCRNRTCSSEGGAPMRADAFPGSRAAAVVADDGGHMAIECAAPWAKLSARMMTWGFEPIGGALGATSGNALGTAQKAAPGTSPDARTTAGKGGSARGPIFNTRIETAASSPFWRDSFAGRRCIVPVAAFFEPHRNEMALGAGGRRVKQSYRFADAGGAALLLAGIWKGDRFSILTCEPDEAASPVHDRMPVALSPEAARSWLFGTQSPNGAANIDRLGDAAPCGIALEARPVYPAAPETGQLSLF